MKDDTTATTPGHTGTTFLCMLLAASGTAGMTAATDSLRRTAETSHADQALIGWVLVVLAALGALLCLYLTVVWGLATAVLLAGPATRIGTASLAALRLLAPRLAQRVATGAAVATTATALVLAPATASEGHPASSALSERAPAQTAQLLPTDGPLAAPSPEPAASGSAAGSDAAESRALLPPLDWGEEPSATQPAPDGSASTVSPASAAPTAAPAEDETTDETTMSSPHIVIVRSGDSLWSITDDLLSPRATAAAEISASWPLLHEANYEVIGADPDHLVPGMELTVPHALTTKDMP
ncbi:MAG: LysM peptidoglycan-binding domain-containing protein [Brachybacterium sp.]